MKTDKAVREKYRWGVIKYHKHEKETYQSREQNRRPELREEKIVVRGARSPMATTN